MKATTEKTENPEADKEWKYPKMEAFIVQLTSLVAKRYLEENIGNRKVRTGRVKEYTESMNNGSWQENGESIILDKNGHIKNGQHRLMAVIESGYSYQAVIVTGVDIDTNKTIDTGILRTLGDVLESKGVKNSLTVSAIVRKILSFKRGDLSNKLSGVKRITNTAALDLYFGNPGDIQKLFNISQGIWRKSTERILGKAEIAKYLFMLQGFDYDEKGKGFIEHVCGVRRIPNTAVNFLYKALASAKKDKIKLNPVWIAGMIIKAWNLFTEGNPAVQSIWYNIDKPLPRIVTPNSPLREFYKLKQNNHDQKIENFKKAAKKREEDKLKKKD